MKGLRILYWTELFWPHIGGVETFSRHLMSALKTRGHEFSVITSASDKAGAGEARLNGIQIHRFDFQRVIAQRDLKAIQGVRTLVTSLIHRIDPNLVHIHSSQPSIFFYSLVHKNFSLPTIFTCHGLHPKLHRANSLAARQMRTANWVTAVSKATLAQAQQLIPEIKPRSSVIYNGLPIPDKPVASLPSGHQTLLCIGRVVKNKGFDLAIKALPEIRKAIPSAQLVIAGEGPAKPCLESLAQTLGLGDAVAFLGWCEPDLIPELIDSSSVVIVPSRVEESFGLVALEAAQRARPVIAADLGGLPEVVAHKKSGLLFKEENHHDLAQKVITLLSHPQSAAQMGRAARVRAENQFSLEVAAEAYNNLYQELAWSNIGERA